jgi:superfamily II DNA helicase RecQ
MQIKLFSVPTYNGEAQQEALNRFLRSKKILTIDKELSETVEGKCWCFCVTYMDTPEGQYPEKKVDYLKLLDDASFKRFSIMREIRKGIANEEGIPAFTVLSDAEMAELAKIEGLDLEKMAKVKGIGEKKLAKYGKRFWFFDKWCDS